jgi:hypothetical protein
MLGSRFYLFPHFWQRASSTSALYMQGPKAQQILHRDIARCVTEIRELQRLGSLRETMPGELRDGQVPDPSTPQGSIDQWETPSRDGSLRSEFLDFHDFETCMDDKGWERVEHVPYSVAEQGREIYVETILEEQYQTKTKQDTFRLEAPKDDFENLNE